MSVLTGILNPAHSLDIDVSASRPTIPRSTAHVGTSVHWPSLRDNDH